MQPPQSTPGQRSYGGHVTAAISSWRRWPSPAEIGVLAHPHFAHGWVCTTVQSASAASMLGLAGYGEYYVATWDGDAVSQDDAAAP